MNLFYKYNSNDRSRSSHVAGIDDRNTMNSSSSSSRFYVVAIVLVAAFLPTCKSERSSLPITSNIPTHHGINASLHLNGGGGAVATRSPLKKRFYSRVIPSSYRRRNNQSSASTYPSANQEDETTKSNLNYPSVYTSYSVKPNLNELNSLENNGNGAVSSSSATATSTSTTALSAINPTPALSKSSTQAEAGLSPTAITCMSLLALQFGIQPILVRKYTPQTIVRSSVVLVQELVKFGIAGAIYFSGTGRSKSAREKDFEGWSIKTWLTLAGLPAFLYTIQNVASLMAYQNLEALTFNVLNQTKILSAALSCYFVMGKQQSRMQIVSLCLLIVSTLVIERIVHPSLFVSMMLSIRGGVGGLSGLGWGLSSMQNAFKSLTGMTTMAEKRVTHGIIPILVASLISGLAGALTQLNLQGGSSPSSRKPIIWGRSQKTAAKSETAGKEVVSRPPRNAYLFSMEMNIASVILLLASMLFSSDGRSILKSGSFFSEWTPQTFIPVITNAIGGILVGLVTKHAGSVRKGFALIFGLLLSGIFQANGAGIRAEQIVGGALAGLSLWMHTVHPFVAKDKKKVD